jgi:hypothetical protein
MRHPNHPARRTPLKIGTHVALSLLVLLLAAPTMAQDTDALMNKTPDELQKGIENAHPATYYILAQKLFQDGRKDDAVFWFYAGQLRYRFHLAANPGLDPSGDPALFASLSEVIGRPINEYAFGDVDALVAIFDRVLEWDEKTPNGFTSKTQHAKPWQDNRAGLGMLRNHVVENAASIRSQRSANGLENRK